MVIMDYLILWYQLLKYGFKLKLKIGPWAMSIIFTDEYLLLIY